MAQSKPTTLCHPSQKWLQSQFFAPHSEAGRIEASFNVPFPTLNLTAGPTGATAGKDALVWLMRRESHERLRTKSTVVKIEQIKGDENNRHGLALPTSALAAAQLGTLQNSGE